MIIKKQSLYKGAAQLWVGNRRELLHRVDKFLCEVFCLNGFCEKCTTCSLIKERKFSQVIQLDPDGRYTLDQLDPIFKQIRFKLFEKERFFFIINKADSLSLSCSNSLLKFLEEPPSGYSFILLAESYSRIMPTISSRCFTSYFFVKNVVEENFQLINSLGSLIDGNENWCQFWNVLDKLNLNDIEGIELLDSLFEFLVAKLKKAYLEKKSTSSFFLALSVLKRAARKQAMPGSNKIFWKNVFLQIFYALNCKNRKTNIQIF